MADPVDDLGMGDLGLDYGTKKKKKAKAQVEAAPADTEIDEAEGSAAASASVTPWVGSDRDYTYHELLKRVFQLLHDKNPELVGGKKFQLQPPQVVREGTKKTVFLNFREVCKSMSRNKEHLHQFFSAELGTDCSIDGSDRLVIKGRFYPKQIESIIKKYMTEFVQCQLCRAFDTGLIRDPVTRLYFLECNRCNAKKSVQQVKAGFHATTKADRKAAKQKA
eukprot:CAMPEP_0114561094 /NCGR_PEP_ID=MMETSP0114-20121206/11818_1 /TAXON_ID=31324 /ORGANISM="Goniomonas sp, Strain m" /LENGTH=220 /DNA_ID=CAMNT_0001746701 /DNA_START=23 /DNA_END=685 /DNA_ORIENTATION=+